MSEVYLKVTDKNGRSWRSNHITWDASRFVASTRESHKKEGGAVEVITRDEYRDAKWGVNWRKKVLK